jgi:hypothetical protein
VKPLTFSPSQAARLLREARNKIENLTALISTGDPTDAHRADRPSPHFDYDSRRILQSIREARQHADFVIVYQHKRNAGAACPERVHFLSQNPLSRYLGDLFDPEESRLSTEARLFHRRGHNSSTASD